MNISDQSLRGSSSFSRSGSESSSDISCKTDGEQSVDDAVGEDRLREIGAGNRAVTARVSSTVESCVSYCRNMLLWGADSSVAEVDAGEAWGLLEDSIVPAEIERKLSSADHLDLKHWRVSLFKASCGWCHARCRVTPAH